MINHDATHCLDYTPKCPQECYRAQITKALKEERYPYPVSFSYFKGTDECLLNEFKSRHLRYRAEYLDCVDKTEYRVTLYPFNDIGYCRNETIIKNRESKERVIECIDELIDELKKLKEKLEEKK